jgi:hypothetical protein
MTDAEVETLAQDVVARRVFGSWDLGPPGSPDMLRMIFMPLGFMTAEDVAALKAANITNFYEYLDKAGPRSVNGYPCFFSMKLLDQDDSKRLLASVLELQSVLKRRMEEASAKADKASG